MAVFRSIKELTPWIRTESDRSAIEAGCYFDESKGRRVVEFIERFCKQSQGEFGGMALKLLPWQRDFLYRLYGWRRADGRRRARFVYLEVPKKNGKSTLLSAIALYHLVADGERGPKVFCNAYDREQASIVFDEAASMVRSSPFLARRLDIVETKKRIRFPKANGRLQANSADVPSKDGANASLTIFDELHRQSTWDLWRIFRYAGAARRQPLTISITTAGFDRQSVCYAQHEHALEVISGRRIDVEFLGVVYGATADEDWRDKSLWARCNPSLGTTLQVEDFERDVREIEQRPSELNEFLRLRLCVWTQAGSRFIVRDAWDACGQDFPRPDWFRGRRCFAGLDLSATTDLTAFVRVFPEDSKLYVLLDCWLPGDSAVQRVKRDRVPYDAWIDQGWIHKTAGKAIDHLAIRQRILEAHAETPIANLLSDPWNATVLLTMLQQDGIPLATISQSPAFVSGATKELERLYVEGLLRHGGNPVLTWAADNAEAEKDRNENLRLSKSRSRDRIDPLAALVNAIAAQMAAPGESIYERQGLTIL